MIMTKEQIAELNTASKPLIKFLNDHCNPHAKVIVECDGAELLSGSVGIKCDEFIKD